MVSAFPSGQGAKRTAPAGDELSGPAAGAGDCLEEDQIDAAGMGIAGQRQPQFDAAPLQPQRRGLD